MPDCFGMALSPHWTDSLVTATMHSLSSPFSLFTSVFCSVILYWISLAIHRLYFSPVAHIPGPFLAKISFWYGIDLRHGQTIL